MTTHSLTRPSIDGSTPPPARRTWRPVAILGAAVVLLTATVVVLLLTRDGGGSSVAGTTFRVGSSSIAAEASSTLASDGDVSFDVENTLDHDLATAWNSDGASRPDPRGVVLTYRFASAVPLNAVRIVNGYAVDDPTYAANARVRSATVRDSSGTERTWSLEDTAEPQTLELGGAPTTEIQLVVDDVYPGETFADLAVSEVAFLVRAS